MPAARSIHACARFYQRRVGKLASILPLLAYLVLFPAACTMHMPSGTFIPNAPETKIIDLRSSLVMKAVAKVMNEKKFVVNPAGTTPQNLESEWLVDGFYRSMMLAEVKPLGKFQSELTLQLRLERKTFWNKSWQPLDRVERTVYADLMNAVLIESYRILYDGR